MSALITSGQKESFIIVGQHAGKHAATIAVDKVPLNRRKAQHLLGKGDVIKDRMADFMIDLVRELTADVGSAPCPRLLRLDPSHPFIPAEFIGRDWEFDKGEEQHPSLLLPEVDPAKLLFPTCLQEGEKSITGEKKLLRLQKMRETRLHSAWGRALWLDYKANPEDSILEWLYEEFGIEYLDFFAGILLSPNGHRDVLCLYRGDDGSWGWGCHWLGHGYWDASRPSAVLAS